ncbi:sulfotransferase [Actinomadura graeca]|uniref:Sulfotransferase n=1 Tax=Actinomadura graeca TaxID=2750812 RepID=A0ABX8QZN6_9ACTN|nr:sulfotransferase [Actinomadura graeca]QXJ24093.1 sulfotransferase [Actinomadura graeca]
MSPGQLGARPDRPIFVLGCPRSGMALLRLMLDAHHRIAMPADTRFLLPAYTARCEFGDLRVRENRHALAEWIIGRRETRFRTLGLDPAEVIEEIVAGPPTLGSALALVFRAHARRHGKPRWGDARPSYSRHVGPLLRMFPDAQFVHLIRDGRDCVASLEEAPWYRQDVHHAIAAWREAIDTGRRLAARLDYDAYYEIQYERLVADPADELIRLCGFLGEEFDPAMTRPEDLAGQTVPDRADDHRRVLDDRVRPAGDHARPAGDHARPAGDHARTAGDHARTADGPITSSRVGAWAQRLDPWEISLAEAAFGGRLAEYGYEPSGLPRPPAAQLARFGRTSAHRRVAQRKADLRERWQRHHEPGPVESLLILETSVPEPSAS